MKWTFLEVWIDENKKGEITVSVDKKNYRENWN